MASDFGRRMGERLNAFGPWSASVSLMELWPSCELVKLPILRCAVLSIAEGLSNWRDEIPERSSGLLSLKAREVVKCTEDWVERVGDGGWAKEPASFEDTHVREGDGERVRSREERWVEEDGRGGYGERRSGGGEGERGWSFTRESLEERSVVTIAGMFGAAGGMSGKRGAEESREKDI